MALIDVNFFSSLENSGFGILVIRSVDSGEHVDGGGGNGNGVEGRVMKSWDCRRYGSRSRAESKKI